MLKYFNNSYALITVLGIIGVISLLIITKHGIGVGVDSVTYIGGAINLFSGKGYSAYTLSGNSENLPITRFPPFFSVAMAFFGYINIGPLAGARLINSFLFGAIIFAVGLIINEDTNNSIWFSFLGSFLMLTSTDLLVIHSFANSEPLFIFFSSLGLFILCHFIANSNKIFLIMSGILIALGLLTRFAAVACIVAGIIGIFLLSKDNFIKRFLYCLTFFIISILPMSLWLLRNAYFSTDLTGRKFVYHPIGIDFFKSLLSVVSKWLIPSDHLSPMVMTFILSALLTTFIVLIYHIYNNEFYKNNAGINYIRASYPIIPSIFIIYSFCYLLFIIIAKSFYDAYIPINDRILSPIYPAFIIILISIFYRIYNHYLSSTAKDEYYKINIIRYVYYVCFITLGTAYLVHGSTWALNAQKDGGGYSSVDWQKSDIMYNISKITSKRIYSNACDAIYIITGKGCYRLPNKYDPTILEVNKEYFYEMAILKNQLAAKKAVLCYIDKLSWRSYLPSEEELKKELNLQIIIKCNDGTIYAIGD